MAKMSGKGKKVNGRKEEVERKKEEVIEGWKNVWKRQGQME